jgi:hypothetical protein
MAHPGLGRAKAAAFALVAACGGVSGLVAAACGASAGPSGPPPQAPPASSADPASGFEGTRWGRFHSVRFELSLEFPDGARWRIDDHKTPWLLASHEASRSELYLRAWSEERPVTRQACYEKARSWQPKLPDLEKLQVVEDQLRKLGTAAPERRLDGVTQGMDARVVVGMAPAGGGAASGYVVAVSESIRKCRVVVYETAGGLPEEMADKLAVVAHKMLDSLRLDASFAPAREPFPASGSAR